MARKYKRRSYGSGCLLKVKSGWAIRWREYIRQHDGSIKRTMRYETLGDIPKGKASEQLLGRMKESVAVAQQSQLPVSFREHGERWEKDILPFYKFSTRKGHGWILKTHLLPRFGNMTLPSLSTQEIQGWVSGLYRGGSAPHTIAHVHEVLSSILRMAVEWGHIPLNPARGVVLPKLKLKREKWILTPKQASDLATKLEPKPRTMVVLALTTGMRRGELLALRWGSLDEDNVCLRVNEAVYDGQFDTPKTKAGERVLPLSVPVLALLQDWKRQSKRVAPTDLVFGTRTGKPASPNNVLRRHIFPACDNLGLSRATWLTFRRTYSSWSHDRGVPDKVTAALMGHSNVYTTLNVYTQVVDDSKRLAVEKIGHELFSIVQFSGVGGGKGGVDTAANPPQNEEVSAITGS